MARPSLKRIIVFAGAGASFAVSRSKYPTTAGFIERFPADLKDDQLIQHLSSHFASKFGDATPDVEKILWCLEELLAFCELTRNQTSPVSWLIPNNLLSKMVGSNANVSQFAQVAKLAIGKVKNIRDRINAQLYEVYAETPTAEEVSTCWKPLIEGLVEQGFWLDLVTTNYDLVVETVVSDLNYEIGYGLTRGPVPKLDTAKWKNYLTEKQTPYQSGLVTKLHGSLNWERDRGGVVFAGTNFKSDHRHHAAIYPGFKGVPGEEPFSLFHDYFERVLQEASHVIFIGFAFRDDYINTLLRRTSHQEQFVAVDPSSLSNLPQDLKSRVHHIEAVFDLDSVNKILRLVDR